jgi:hypothetical protein
MAPRKHHSSQIPAVTRDRVEAAELAARVRRDQCDAAHAAAQLREPFRTHRAPFELRSNRAHLRDEQHRGGDDRQHREREAPSRRDDAQNGRPRMPLDGPHDRE